MNPAQVKERKSSSAVCLVLLRLSDRPSALDLVQGTPSYSTLQAKIKAPGKSAMCSLAYHMFGSWKSKSTSTSLTNSPCSCVSLAACTSADRELRAIRRPRSQTHETGDKGPPWLARYAASARQVREPAWRSLFLRTAHPAPELFTTRGAP